MKEEERRNRRIFTTKQNETRPEDDDLPVPEDTTPPNTDDLSLSLEREGGEGCTLVVPSTLKYFIEFTDSILLFINAPW